MDFRKLRYFVAAVEEDSFSKAAQKCYISQTAISQQIAAVEKELGVKLFNRDGYRANITVAGKKFYESSKDLLSQYEIAVNSIKKYKSQYSEVLKVGISGPIELNILPGIIDKFIKENPNVEIELKKKSFFECSTDLQRDKLDVIFVIDCEMKGIEGVEIIPLFKPEICVITSLNHKFSKKENVLGYELKNEDLIVFSENFSNKYYNSFLESCRNDGFEPHIIKKVDTLEEMILLVSSGMGIAVISSEIACNYEKINYNILKNSHHNTNYCIVKNKISNEIADKFISCVLESMNS